MSLEPVLVEPRAGPLAPPQQSNGCFETMRAYQGRIFRLEDHLDRLYASAVFLGTRAPKNRRRLAAQLTDALKRSAIAEAVVRVALIPQPSGDARPHTQLGAEGYSKAQLSVGARPHIVVQPATLPSAEAYRRGIAIAVVPARKFSVGGISPQAKYSARLGSVMAVSDAQLRGVDEALFLDETGSVTESTASNFGIVKNGVVQTPPFSLGLLAGITRDALRELAAELRLGFEEIPLTRHDLYNADEAFLTSTLKEILPVSKIDGRIIGSGRGGPVCRRLLAAFRQLVRRELRLK